MHVGKRKGKKERKHKVRHVAYVKLLTKQLCVLSVAQLRVLITTVFRLRYIRIDIIEQLLLPAYFLSQVVKYLFIHYFL